ncbi:MAG: precorrin-6y C5,15-methyltransferase (decarboxylating) subunit CbiE [Pseudomonadota bacterium]
MSASTQWISVIGVDDAGLEALPDPLRNMVENADVIFGGERHLAMLGEHPGERHGWRWPLVDTMADIEAQRGKNVVVLATGDPQWYGIGSTLGRYFSPDDLQVCPAISAFSLAASKLGWPIAACETVTLHGRPLALLERHIYPRAKVLALSEDHQTPEVVARWLSERGFGESQITVLEHLGGARENIRSTKASAFSLADIADLNTLAIECVADEGAVWNGPGVGLRDDSFANDQQITKQIVRAATLGQLSPFPGGLLWDVGAGCGSVAIEWMRQGGRAVAIEARSDRCKLIDENRKRFGLPALKMIEGRAPDALSDLETPDAIFIGGGLSETGVFDACWKALQPGGRLVANMVTLESEQFALALQAKLGGTLNRISLDTASPVGAFRGWRPSMPVLQWSVRKISGDAP